MPSNETPLNSSKPSPTSSLPEASSPHSPQSRPHSSPQSSPAHSSAAPLAPAPLTAAPMTAAQAEACALAQRIEQGHDQLLAERAQAAEMPQDNSEAVEDLIQHLQSGDEDKGREAMGRVLGIR